MSTSQPNPPAPLLPSQRARSFIVWAFVISIGAHFLIGGLVPYKAYTSKDQEVEKVSVTKKTKLVVPTPPPTPTPPPPTPPPKETPPPITSTQPPPQPRLKLNVPKTTSKGQNSSAENSYVAPKQGSENGVPQGTVATGPPAPTAGPATAAPAPTPTPRSCAQPHLDATTTRPVEPDYPEIARQQGATGTVQVKVQLSATGSVTGVSVYKSSGNQALDQEALKAARASQYRAEVDECAPIAGTYLFRADFNNQ
jgi:protein TonB